MSETFDAYYKWLAIPPEEQPPHHYRLLGLRPFETDADVIANAADQRMTHVRTFQSGKNAAHSQKILNEISTAKVCLLNPARKADYDKQLRARLAAAHAPTAPPAAPSPAPAAMAAAGMHAPPAPPGYGVAGAGMAAQPSARPTVQPQRPAAATRPAPAAAESELEDFVAPSRRRSGARGRRQSPSFVGPVLLIGFLIAALAGTVYFLKNHSVDELIAKVDPNAARGKSKSGSGEAGSEGHGRHHEGQEAESDADGPEKTYTPPEGAVAKLLKRAGARVTAGQTEATEYVGGPGGTIFTDIPKTGGLLVGFWVAVKAADEAQGDAQASISSIAPVFLLRDGAPLHRLKPHGGGETASTHISAKPGYAVAGLEVTPGERVTGMRVLFRAIDNSGLSKTKSYHSPWIGQASKEPVVLGDGRAVVGIGGKSSDVVNQMCLILEGSGKLAPAGEGSAGGETMDPSSDPSVPTAMQPTQPSFIRRPGSTSSGTTPVPTDDELREAKAKLHELFKPDYSEISAAATKPQVALEKKFALAKKLFHESEKENDPINRYAMLDEARRLAMQVGDSQAVLETIYSLGARYQIDDVQLTVDSFIETGNAPTVSNFKRKLAENSLMLIGKAIERERFDVAEKLEAQALKAAKSTSDGLLQQQVIWRRARLLEQRKAYESAQAAFEKLKEDANDPAANLAAGRYRCLIQENWKEGLPLLAKGNDEALKHLAEQELQPPGEAVAQAKLGDEWVAAARDESLAPYYQMRARQWYELALPRLAAVSRRDTQVKLEKMLGGHGLKAEYFAGAANFDNRVKSSVDANIDINWAQVPADDVPPTPFTVRWTGWLVPPGNKGGQFMIGIDHNAGARLYIDNKLVIDVWAGEGRQDMPYVLQANKPRNIKLEYVSNGNRNDAKISLRWSQKDGFPDQPVPPEALYQERTGAEKGFAQLPVPKPSNPLLYIATPEAPAVLPTQ